MVGTLNSGLLRLGHTQLWEIEGLGVYVREFLKKYFSLFLCVKAVLLSFGLLSVAIKLVVYGFESITAFVRFVNCRQLAFTFDEKTARFLSGKPCRKALTKVGVREMVIRRSFFVGKGVAKVIRHLEGKKQKFLGFGRVGINPQLATQIYEIDGEWDAGWLGKKWGEVLLRQKRVARWARLSRVLLKIKTVLWGATLGSCKLKFQSVLSNVVFKRVLRVVFKRVRRGPKSRYLIRSKYFFDLLAVIGSSLFFYKSDVLATYVSIIVNRHRNLIKYLGDVRRTLKVWHLRAFYGRLALRIGVFGKIKGQKSRRFRRYLMFYGRLMPERSVQFRMDYTLIHIYNIYGGFGVKVWLFFAEFIADY